MSKMKGRWINTDSSTITASGDNLEVNIDSAGALSASINGIDVNTFSPATSTTDGLKGAIPAPLSGDVVDRKALFADGFRQVNLSEDLADVNIEAPSSISNNGEIFGKFYQTASGFGDSSDGSPDISGGSVGNVYTLEDHEGASSDVVNSGMGAGTTTFDVRSASGFAIGDSCYLHQTQIGNTGTLTQRGQYEEVTISNIVSNTITLQGGTALPYVNNTSGSLSINPKVQLVKIVQYATLDIPAGHTITAKPWDGFSGGLLALKVINLEGDGQINMNKAGFRGGSSSGQDGEGWHGWGGFQGGGGDGSAGNGAQKSGGGGHNGQAPNSQGTGGADYGILASDIVDRINFGGGGGGWNNSNGADYDGGNSGGAVIVSISDHTLFNGVITSNGEASEGGNAGGGSGGSVLVRSTVLFPSGRVTVTRGDDTSGFNIQGAIGYEYIEVPTFTDTADFRTIGKIDTDITLGGATANDSEIPTQLAIKTYVDAQVGGAGSIKLSETLTYEDTYHTIGPLSQTPITAGSSAAVEVTPTGGFDQTYESDYTVIELTVAGSTGLALGFYIAVGDDTTTLIGVDGGTATGSDPSTGIDDIFSNGETAKATYTY